MVCKLSLPADMRALARYLGTKNLKEENVEASSAVQVRKVSWEEEAAATHTSDPGACADFCCCCFRHFRFHIIGNARI